MFADFAVALSLLVGGGGYLAMAGYVVRHRHSAGAYALLAFLMSIFVWATCYALEVQSRTIPGAQFWSSLKYLGIVGVPVSLLAFTIEYTGNGRRLSRTALLLLLIEPIVVLTVRWTPPLQDLLLVFPAVDEGAAPLTQAPIPASGPLFYPHAAYSWVVLATALSMLVARLVRIARPYRRQALVIGVVSVLPFAGSLVWNIPGSGLTVDPTPFLFAVLAVTLVWGFFRLRLLDLLSVARGAVVEQMTDGLLVLDAFSRVVDANPAAVNLLGLWGQDVIGRNTRILLPQAAGLIDRHLPGASVTGEVTLESASIGRPAGEEPLHVSLQLTSLTDRHGSPTGRLLVLHDVTQQTITERRLRELLEAETHMVSVLRSSIRPSTLPRVPGLSIAARSVPAGQSVQLSGDFYDVHQSVGGDWAFVIGEVAEKGVHAAAVTSMARYTVRTLSAQGWSPKQVLEQLNQAILNESQTQQLCRVMYARLTPFDSRGDDADPTPGVRVTVALAGHSPPMVRRRDGTIESIGRPGTVLGIVAGVEVAEVRIDLLPGDVLVAYTEGMSEARNGGEEFGEYRLAQALGASAASTGRGGVAVRPRQAHHSAASLNGAAPIADVVADGVVDAVTGFATHRDDVALLVVAVP